MVKLKVLEENKMQKKLEFEVILPPEPAHEPEKEKPDVVLVIPGWRTNREQTLLAVVSAGKQDKNFNAEAARQFVTWMRECLPGDFYDAIVKRMKHYEGGNL